MELEKRTAIKAKQQKARAMQEILEVSIFSCSELTMPSCLLVFTAINALHDPRLADSIALLVMSKTRTSFQQAKNSPTSQFKWFNRGVFR